MERNKAMIIIVALVLVAGGTALLVGSTSNDDRNQSTPESTSETTNQLEADTSNSTQSETSQTPDSETGAIKEVEIANFKFAPQTLTVKVGDTVKWTNQDSTQHNVTADDSSSDAPDGPLLSKGESYSFTFKKAGTYKYHCDPHPQMQATVIVE